MAGRSGQAAELGGKTELREDSEIGASGNRRTGTSRNWDVGESDDQVITT
jgi:hypothetical protein